ncbi:hypothetical protein [Streptomyces sp. JH34]|uniref:hypothetical protein n=1 Tax=Streptomyces sp. JH34 TaxID=2793633 RepID=UPI0023F88973|nr:hypothetical protein [Streptomyces sp. JH34]MDF6017211.1 hypothetical protein [Streptomyces sp. JH34]
MKPGRCHRAVRAALFAAVCVLLAATGHVLMSGTPVPGWVLFAALAGTTAAAWFLAGRERGVLAVTTAAVAAQTALHAGFTYAQSLAPPPPLPNESFARQWAGKLLCGDGATLLSERDAVAIVTDAGLGSLISRPPPGTFAPAADPVGHSHHAMHGVPIDAAGTVQAVHGGQGVFAAAPTGMLAAHLLAALLCGLWLAYGERAFFRVLRALAWCLRTPLHLLLRLAAPPRRPRRSVRRRPAQQSFTQLLLVHSITSRGPPRGTAAVRALRAGSGPTRPVAPASSGPTRPGRNALAAVGFPERAEH